MTEQKRRTHLSALLLSFLAVFSGKQLLISANKYNQRIFMDDNAIAFSDPLRSGFRVILTDEFVKTHLQSRSLPTLFVTAIPLKAGGSRFTKILYPENRPAENKLVRIDGLKEKSWYYVCVEWENINRHNETTGTTCRLFRTIDRQGRTATNVISDMEVAHLTDVSLHFKTIVDADFPLRVTAFLHGGKATAPAQSFVIKSPTTAEIVFPFLKPDTDYGQLCIIEEPLVPGYSAMGRQVYGLNTEKCYFEGLRTKKLQDRPMATQPDEARQEAYRRVLENSATFRSLTLSLALMSVSLYVFL